jgi:hypothetical protein
LFEENGEILCLIKIFLYLLAWCLT